MRDAATSAKEGFFAPDGGASPSDGTTGQPNSSPTHNKPNPARRQPMRLYVEAHGRTVPLEVSGSTDAASVLRKLRRRNVRSDRLALRGRPWTVETVAQLGLQPHTTIQALGRLKGGCLEHSLKLYMRCMHLFKIIIAFYMFCMGPCLGVESNRCGRTPSRRLGSRRRRRSWSLFRF